jgi:type IV fimbrial biogenesis protein FimT
MKKSSGFTLIELMVVIAITSILILLAVPSFRSLIQSTAISSNVNNFLADMRFARSESVRLGGGVIMCRSNAPEAPSPACNNGSGPGGNGWVSGWIIFHDVDGNGNRNAASTDPVLRVQARITSIDTISINAVTRFTFTATGRLTLGSITSMLFGGAAFPSSAQRVVCINVGGRARIAGDGLSSCP